MSSAEDRESLRPPPYDAAVISRLANKVQIRDVELLGAQFERVDAGPLAGSETAGIPDLGIAPGAWAVNDEGTLGCLVSFFADFNQE